MSELYSFDLADLSLGRLESTDEQSVSGGGFKNLKRLWLLYKPLYESTAIADEGPLTESELLYFESLSDSALKLLLEQFREFAKHEYLIRVQLCSGGRSVASPQNLNISVCVREDDELATRCVAIYKKFWSLAQSMQQFGEYTAFSTSHFPFSQGQLFATHSYFNGSECTGDSLDLQRFRNHRTNVVTYRTKCSTYLSRCRQTNDRSILVEKQSLTRLTKTPLCYIDVKQLTASSLAFEQQQQQQTVEEKSFFIVNKNTTPCYMGLVSIDKSTVCLFNLYADPIMAGDVAATVKTSCVTLSIGRREIYKSAKQMPLFYSMRHKQKLKDYLACADQLNTWNKEWFEQDSDSFTSVFIDDGDDRMSLISHDRMINIIQDELNGVETDQQVPRNVPPPLRMPWMSAEQLDTGNEADTRSFMSMEEELVDTFLNSVDRLNYRLNFFSNRVRLGEYAEANCTLVREFMEYSMFKVEFDEWTVATNRQMFRQFYKKLLAECRRIYTEFVKEILKIYPRLGSDLDGALTFKSMFSSLPKKKQTNNQLLIPPCFYIGTTTSYTENALAELTQRELDLFVLYGAGLLKSAHVNEHIMSNANRSVKFEHLFTPLNLRPVHELRHEMVRRALDESIGMKKPTNVDNHNKKYSICVLIKKPVLNLSRFKFDLWSLTTNHVKSLGLHSTARFDLHPTALPSDSKNKRDSDDYVYCSLFNSYEHDQAGAAHRIRQKRPMLKLEPFKIHSIH